MTETVIVLHGLALNNWWTSGLARRLTKAGYDVHNISYPSRKIGFEQLVDEFLKPLVDSLPSKKVHFVVHSMGGLMVRLYAKKYGTKRIGRVVMLGTPNNGSECADLLREAGLFRWFFGETGEDLGIRAASLPAKLGPVNFECGVIAGNNNLFLFPAVMAAGIKGESDGVVTVESTKVEGMKDHIVLWVDHSMMAWSADVGTQAMAFLKTGAFSRPGPSGSGKA